VVERELLGGECSYWAASRRRRCCGRGRRWRRPATRPAGPRRGDRGRPRAGRLAGRGAVAVDGTTYTAEHVVVATGSDPAFPPAPGLRELPGLWTDGEVTGLTEVPRRLLVLGGGPIGVEMA
jgi:hypothetical protein